MRPRQPPNRRATSTSTDEEGARVLLEVLERSQSLGFLGDAPLASHVAHAEAFVGVAEFDARPGPLLDLGSGGGLPGLVLAVRVPRLEVILLEGGTRRAAFLGEAVQQLDLGSRVRVVGERAEIAARSPELRHVVSTVVSRGFGPPAVTAECAAPFLRRGGCLVVSEPPPGSGGENRWPAAGCAVLGLELEQLTVEPFAFVRLRQRELCDARYPRRVGVPSKRPLF